LAFPPSSRAFSSLLRSLQHPTRKPFLINNLSFFQLLFLFDGNGEIYEENKDMGHKNEVGGGSKERERKRQMNL
jgi:hypothetical protein